MGFRCESCNGSMVFDVTSQQMRCRDCGNTCDPQDFVVSNRDTSKGAGKSTGLAAFACPDCGASLAVADDSVVGKCPYCGGQSMRRRRGVRLGVEGVTPFCVSKRQCVKAYMDYTKRIPFLPSELSNPKYLKRFTGMFVPFYEYDVRYGISTFTGRKTIERRASEETVEHYRIDTKVPELYERCCTFDGSRYLDDEIARQIQPFGSTRRKPFNPAYLMGFCTDVSTVAPRTYHSDVCAGAKEDLLQIVSKRMKDRHDIDVDDNTSKVKARVAGSHGVLRPLWFLAWRKDGRVAYAAINGETSKVVSDLPIDLRTFSHNCAVLCIGLFTVMELLIQSIHEVIPLVTLLVSIAIAYGILMSASMEYQRRSHVDDGGWTGEETSVYEKHDNASAAVDKLRTWIKGGAVLALIVVIICWVRVSLSARESTYRFPTLVDETLIELQVGLRFVFSACAFVCAVYAAFCVRRWNRDRWSSDSVVSAGALLTSVCINLLIRYSSFMNGYWRYGGETVCLAALAYAAYKMIRVYNDATTRLAPQPSGSDEVAR